VQAGTISFVIRDATGTAVPSSLSYDAATHTATLTPGADLGSATTYTATVSGARDPAGNVLAAPVVWTFTTADTEPPALVGRTPAPGATGIAAASTVTATFSEDVQAATVSFVLTDAGGAVVPSSLSYDAGAR